jgi:cytochrome c oxidase assembly protein subunit 11
MFKKFVNLSLFSKNVINKHLQAPKRNNLRRHTFRFFSKQYKKKYQNLMTSKSTERGWNLWLLNSGILATVFGACFMMVPLYKLFCQKVGLEGNLEQKDYSKMNKKKLNRARKFLVEFKSESDPEMGWTFEPVTNELEVHAGETALAFYKVKNNRNKPIIGISTYTIVPEYGANYFAKVQCFCFNQQMLNAQEELYLPLYFYLEPEITEETKMEGVRTIKIIYKFFACKKQKIAEIIHAQTIKELQQKQFILNKRIQKKEGTAEQYKEWTEEYESNESMLESLLDTD